MTIKIFTINTGLDVGRAIFGFDHLDAYLVWKIISEMVLNFRAMFLGFTVQKSNILTILELRNTIYATSLELNHLSLALLFSSQLEMLGSLDWDLKVIILLIISLNIHNI